MFTIIIIFLLSISSTCMGFDKARQEKTMQSKKRAREWEVQDETKRKKRKIDTIEKKNKYHFIYDSYTDSRGTPKMLEIKCAGCHNHVMLYQKDGFGRLLRCYLDRIHAPERLQRKQYEDKKLDVRKRAHLRCLSCLDIIGVPMTYRRENRPAFKMIQDRFYL